jgi:hypothetical protein
MSRMARYRKETDFRAKYYGFWQGHMAQLVYHFQRFTLLVLIALAIASGVEGSDYTSPSSVAVAVQLAKAYGVICIFYLKRSDDRSFPPYSKCNPMGCIVVRSTYGRRCILNLLLYRIILRLSQGNLPRYLSLDHWYFAPQSLRRTFLRLI